jgi:hypothetical protein
LNILFSPKSLGEAVVGLARSSILASFQRPGIIQGLDEPGVRVKVLANKVIHDHLWPSSPNLTGCGRRGVNIGKENQVDRSIDITPVSPVGNQFVVKIPERPQLFIFGRINASRYKTTQQHEKQDNTPEFFHFSLPPSCLISIFFYKIEYLDTVEKN